MMLSRTQFLEVMRVLGPPWVGVTAQGIVTATADESRQGLGPEGIEPGPPKADAPNPDLS